MKSSACLTQRNRKGALSLRFDSVQACGWAADSHVSPPQFLRVFQETLRWREGKDDFSGLLTFYSKSECEIQMCVTVDSEIMGWT